MCDWASRQAWKHGQWFAERTKRSSDLHIRDANLGSVNDLAAGVSREPALIPALPKNNYVVLTFCRI